ncbi:hypothetical protein BBJ28_00020460 [Nothophytophthora sp. Chile5]|nr:hypothetical protein BBJ28_00020460 [Nothophytophthora sp. Chile5]
MHRAMHMRRLSAAVTLPRWRYARFPAVSLSRTALLLPARPSPLLQLRYHRRNAHVNLGLTSRTFVSIVLPDASSKLQVDTPAPETSILSSDQRESVVTMLKARCNALRNDNAHYAAAPEALAAWRQDIEGIQKQLLPLEQFELRVEVLRAYESGVAIASKQRQFGLAAALVDQMRELGYSPTAKTHQYLVRNVALETLAVSQHTAREDLRELLKETPGDTWEREMLTMINREELPVQYKTDGEFALFHQRLIAGLEATLDAYERAIGSQEATEATQATGGKKKQERSTLPYNEALRVCADNGVAFPRMLKLLVTRQMTPDVETYEALLLGARWNEIPATISQLLHTDIVNQLSSSSSINSSEHVRLIWVNAMKAVMNSSNERFGSISASVSKTDVDQLRKVFLFVDKQLSSAFPKFQFATAEHHAEVYEMRIKAAAACGLMSPIKKALDEYVALAPLTGDGGKPALSKAPFLSALELFSWSPMEILLITHGDALARGEARDVSNSPRVAELRRTLMRMRRRMEKAQKAEDLVDTSTNTEHVKAAKEGEREPQQQVAGTDRNAALDAKRTRGLTRRLETARVLKANQLLIKEHVERADKMANHVLSKLLDAGYDIESDLEVSNKLMEQYKTCAVRYERRLTQGHKNVAPLILERVFKLVQTVSAHVKSGDLDVQDPETREKLRQFFEYAVSTAVRFWRREETEALVRKQQRVLGSKTLDPLEYDLLIFQRVTNADVSGAHALLQEMHNAGMTPSQAAIHRIAIALLYQLDKLPEGMEQLVNEEGGAAVPTPTEEGGEAGTGGELEGEVEEEEHEDAAAKAAADVALDSELTAVLNLSDRDTIEKELGLGGTLKFDDDDHSDADNAALQNPDTPQTVEDLTSFLQDWYNLHGVRPMGKTAVPVLARLIETKNFPEFRRLLQILEAMDGGLTPAAEVWLEKRLDQIGGFTLDDFRLK